jgi:hypothetical protein
MREGSGARWRPEAPFGGPRQGASSGRQAYTALCLPSRSECTMSQKRSPTRTQPETKAAADLTFKVEIQHTTAQAKDRTSQLVHLQRRVLKPALASKRIASEDLDAAVQSVAG